MAIKKNVRFNPNKLAQIMESPEEKRARFYEAQYRVSELAGAPGSTRFTDHDAREKEIMGKANRIAESLDMGWGDLMAGLDMRDMRGLSRNDVMFPEDMQQMQRRGSAPPMQGRQMLTEEFPTHQDNIIMEDLYANTYEKPQPRARSLPPQQQQRQAPRQTLRETITGSPAPRQQQAQPVRQAPAGPPWQVRAFMGETKSGGQIPVWRVVNARTGTNIQTLFRIESIADRVAGLLNESGDQNDPRALKVIGLYENRDRLLKEARLLEKSSDGKPMKTERLRQIRAEINQLDYRLGV
jgi:hypothetical protein